MEKQTRSARRKEKPKANQADSNLVLDLFLKLRYLIGVLVIVVIVTFNLNGSSLGVWDKYVSQRDDGKKTDVIFGQNREVRSDEWLVQTPFYLSQAEEDFPLVNEDYSLNGQNMIIAYNSPVKDITVIGKPFNWGFFFLGRDRGLSFYWAMKLVVMVLLGFEVLMILTKRKKALSLIGAFALTFSPAVQWWFMQHVGDLIFFTLGLMTAFYHYFYNHDKKWLRTLMMLLVVIFGIGFILVIYPAHQVMLAYLLIFYLLQQENFLGSVGCSVDWRGSFIYWRSHGSFLADVKRRIVSFFEYLISRKTSQYRWKVDDWRIFFFPDKLENSF